MVAVSLMAACATTGPSQQLVDARKAYEDARTSPAAEHRPDAVLSARQALRRAEQAHEEDAGSFREQSLAYIAEREARKARARGEYEQSMAAMKQAEQDYKQRQAQLLNQAQRERQDVTQSLQTTRERLQSQQGNLNRTQAELTEERRARQEADRRAALALQSLQEVAQVREEARGVVITLEGAVLFLTGESDLLPLAKRKLEDVARALKDMDSEQQIVIEGHTDSQGGEQMNMELSRNRAESVRDYLVSQGIDAGRITAVGRGETQPLTTNDTPEGRANNRRVEIVLKEPGTSPAGSADAPTPAQETETPTDE